MAQQLDSPQRRQFLSFGLKITSVLSAAFGFAKLGLASIKLSEAEEGRAKTLRTSAASAKATYGSEAPVTGCPNDCSGSCSGTCSGGCSGTCTMGCSNSCEGGCKGDCSGSCMGGCEGTCAGTCEGRCTGTSSK